MSIEELTGESVMDRIHDRPVRKEERDPLQELQKKSLLLLHEQKAKMVEKTLAENHSSLVSVPQVVVNNSNFYRTAFINRQLEPLLVNGQSLKIEDVLKRVDLVVRNFLSCTNTENAVVNLETVRSRDLAVVPIIHLLPVKRFFAKTGTSFGNSEGSGYVTLQLRNFLKGGENLIFDGTVGSRTRTSYLVNFNSPINNSAHLRMESLLFMNNRKIEWASHEQIVRGFSNKIIKYGLGNSNDPDKFYDNFSQEYSFENVWRSVAVRDQAASDAVLFSCGDDFKSSFVYNLQYDNRNSKLLAESGNYIKLQMEYAPGLWQNSNFLKCTFDSLFAQKLSKNWFSNLSWRMGYLHSKSANPHIMDKFNLGGPTDVRGFNFNGLGPRSLVGVSNRNYLNSGGDRLGGDFFYAAGLSLFTVVPRFSPSSEGNLKLHGFLNAGRLCDKSSDWHEMISQPSVSAGVGLAYRYSAARFELNFGVPLTAHVSDSMRKGFQYGIGLSFM